MANLRGLFISLFTFACATLVTSSFAAAANSCEILFSTEKTSFQSAELLPKIRTSLQFLRKYRNGEGTADFDTFFNREKKIIQLKQNSPDENGYSIDGLPARALFTAGAKGVQNAGLYFYSAGDGSRRVVKLLRLSPTTLKDPDTTKQWPLPPAVQEIANAYLGEFFGGPKLYGFGIAKTAEGNFIYLEMEELFVGDKFKTSKDVMKEQKIGKNLAEAKSGEMHRDLAKMMAIFPGGDQLVRNIADLVMYPILFGVAPGDTDFAISSHGKLRWLDTANWQEFGSDRRQLFTEYADVIRKFLPAGHLENEPDLIPQEAHASKIFLMEVLRFLRGSTQFSPSEKRMFIEIVFAEKPQFLASGVTQNQVLFESGIIPNLAAETRSAVDVVKSLFDSI